MAVLAATGPSPFWFLTRGTGAVSLLLLTLTLALGIANVRRDRFPRLPRFVTDSLHRNASLLAVSFLGVHVATALLDGFAPITLLDVVIPFGSAYRPLWLGFGAVALDLMVALTVTSLLRRRLGYRAWRITHWAAYASWPVALLHGLGTGSDTQTHWMLLLSALCVATMLAAVVARVSSGWPERRPLRLAALGGAALVPIGLLAWLPGGPLGRGWARRAGTPATLLASAQPAAASSAESATREPATASGSAPAGESAEREASFRAAVSGTVRQSTVAGGQRLVDISLRADDAALDRLEIRIQGPGTAGGGVRLQSSRVTLGSPADPGQYGGQVTSLNGSEIVASVADPGYAAMSLQARLSLPAQSGNASGTLVATAHEGAH